jgi:hypothetical protein
MRISFDLDGVLADMDTALARLAEREFGKRGPGIGDRGPAQGLRGLGSPGSSDGAQNLSPSEPAPAPGSQIPGIRQGVEAYPAAAPVGSAAIIAQLSAREQIRLWQAVRETANFWESLAEHEPGAVGRLQKLAQELRWDVLFVTQRPSTSGHTPQIQSQRWLRRHGFNLPSVYTTQGSRGRIAAALTLDAHIDDRLEHCVDVATESQAWPILVWRDHASFDHMTANAAKLNIAVVRTVGEALDKLEEADRTPAPKTQTGMLDRLKRAFGLPSRTSAKKGES